MCCNVAIILSNPLLVSSAESLVFLLYAVPFIYLPCVCVCCMPTTVTTDITKVCDLVLDQDDAEELTDAVKSHYWYQLYMDELPIWGMVGEYMQATVDDDGDGRGQLQEQGFIYTHKEFSISYNQNQIIEVNLTSANPRPILAGQSIPMTYAVKWKETKVTRAFLFCPYRVLFQELMSCSYHGIYIWVCGCGSVCSFLISPTCPQFSLFIYTHTCIYIYTPIYVLFLSADMHTGLFRKSLQPLS